MILLLTTLMSELKQLALKHMLSMKTPNKGGFSRSRKVLRSTVSRMKQFK